MIIPYSTDAPIYHWPVATVSLITANCVAFLVIFSFSEEAFRTIVPWLVLTFGNFNPLTWLTANYVEFNPVGLVIAMFNLWVFGLIVEGKVGWWKFLLIYHIIAIGQCALQQVLTILFEGQAWGTAPIIYGLVAISLIWAPANNVQCAYIGMGGSTFDVTVSYWAGFSLFLQFASAVLTIVLAEEKVAAIIGEVTQVLGAAIGAGIGFGMLKQKMVDCEGWDVFSVWEGKHTRSREEIAEDYLKSKEGQERSQELREGAAEQVRKFVAADEALAAWAAYKRGLNQFPGFQLAENDLLALIAVLRKAGKWDETITLMVTFLRTYPARDAAVRLALAQLLIEKKQRGRQAYSVLQKIDRSKLDPRQLPLLDQFATKARALAEDDPYEVAAEDW